MRKLLLGALRLVVLLIALHVASTFVRVAEAGGGVNIGTLRTFVQAIFNGTISISGQVAGNAIVWNGTAWVAGAPAPPAADTWQAVLVAGNTSGGTNPTISTGDSIVGATALPLVATGANSITLTTNATLRLTVSTTQVLLSNTVTLSAPGAGASSEHVGASSTAAAANSIALGNTATVNATGGGIVIGTTSSIGAGATGCVIIGNSVVGRSANSTIIGNAASEAAGATDMTVVGASASSSAGASQGVQVGYQSTIVGVQGATAIGYQAAVDTGDTFSIALGYQALTTDANQLMVGSSGGEINGLYLGGNGGTNATPTTTVTWRVTSATAASGAAGTSIVIRAGEGDGAGADGTITFNTNATNRWTIDGSGHLTVVADSTYNIGASAARVLGTFTDYTAHQRLLVNSSPVTLSATGEELVEVDASGGTRTVNLPDATTTVVGRRYVIKDNGSAGTNNVTVDASGAQLIDGATTYVLSVNYQSVTIWNNGTKWLIE